MFLTWSGIREGSREAPGTLQWMGPLHWEAELLKWGKVMREGAQSLGLWILSILSCLPSIFPGQADFHFHLKSFSPEVYISYDGILFMGEKSSQRPLPVALLFFSL